MIKITFFVHGTTVDNEKDFASGWSDINLSELGIKQAKQLGKVIKDKNFDVVFCSDLKRAMDTSSLVFKNKYEIIPDERLREANYGDWNGAPSEKFKLHMTNYISKQFPNGESYKDIETRIANFLNFLKINYNNKNVAIVAHQAPQLALDVLLKNKTWKQAIDEDWRKTKAYQPGWEYKL